MKRSSSLLLLFLLFTLIHFSPAAHSHTRAAISRGTIAYIRGGAEIHLIEPDGSRDQLIWTHPRPDTAETLGISGLAWRPDGLEIAFTSGHEAQYSVSAANLYKYSFATKEATQLTHFDGEFVRSFSIAPDGQSVVFERAGQFRGGEADLWTMRADGSDMRLLVKNGSSPSWGR